MNKKSILSKKSLKHLIRGRARDLFASENNWQNKILVILGPTASGKSDLALRLARLAQGKPFQKKYGVAGAEIISADSRQVYRGLDIGTGKVPQDRNPKSEILNPKQIPNTKLKTRKTGGCFYKGIQHHLLDVANPKKQFSAAEYQKLGSEALLKIWAKNKLPIICGGTGLYVDALLGQTPLPEVPPDPKLRARLQKLSTPELFQKLQKLNPARAKNIDPKNPRRLIRALEIVLKTGRPVSPIPSNSRILQNTRIKHSHIIEDARLPGLDVFKIGITAEPERLRGRIRARLLKRLREGMIQEAEKLHKNGLSWKRMEELGLEYRWLSRYLRGLITKQEMIQKLETEIWHYARRQMTWWRKDKNIVWIKTEKEARNLVLKFLRT